MNNTYFQSDSGDQRQDAQSNSNRSSPAVVINWIFVLAVMWLGFMVMESHFSMYKTERLFFNSVQDGLQPADMESPFMAKGVERNLKYAGDSNLSFFFRQWLPHLPVYLFFLLIPFILGIINLKRKGKRRLKWPYYISIVLFIGYLGFFIATRMQLI